ncbi:MAG: response regulator transcription factor [Mobilitalea sp.]
MNKIRIAACDDNNIALDMIANAVKNYFIMQDYEVEMETFTEVTSIRKRLTETEFHLLLLDIDMPVMDGISLGNELRNRGLRTSIIFVSNREDKVFASLKVKPDGFIRKSHILEDIPEVLSIYLQTHLENITQNLIIESRDQLHVIPYLDILYIEGNKKYQLLYRVNKVEPIPIRVTLQELEKELEPLGFIRIHKGYLVNYKHIRLIGDTEVEMDNTMKLPISRRKLQEVKSRFLDLMQRKGIVVIK